jgi:hypothetical protein
MVKNESGEFKIEKSDLPWEPENLPVSIGIDPLRPYQVVLEYRAVLKPDPNAPNQAFIQISMGRFGVGIRTSKAMEEIMKDKVCGMCGNINRNQTDEYGGSGKPNLEFLREIVNYPPSPSQSCEPIGNYSLRYLPATTTGRRKRQVAMDNGVCTSDTDRTAAEKRCAVINDPSGPFGVCHGKNKDREAMFDDCVQDTCLDSKFFCSSMEFYALKCGSFGKPGNWRVATKCHLKCPAGMKYNSCVNRDCLKTCQNQNPCVLEDENEAHHCSEGCVCQGDTVWDMTTSKCVPLAVCDDKNRQPEFPQDFTLTDETYETDPNELDNAGGEDDKGKTKKPNTTIPPFFPCAKLGKFKKRFCQVGKFCFRRRSRLVVGNCGKLCVCTKKGFRCRGLERKGKRVCLKCKEGKAKGKCKQLQFLHLIMPRPVFPCTMGMNFGRRGKACRLGSSCFPPGTPLVKGPCQRICVCGKDGKEKCRLPNLDKIPRLKKKCLYCRKNAKKCPLVFLGQVRMAEIRKAKRMRNRNS